MEVYRVGRTKYARDLKGIGARLFGGRWNNEMVACLYTSESRALAVLEYTVNINIEDVPRLLSITTIDIPENNIRMFTEAELPGDWKTAPAPSSTKDFGSAILLATADPVIKIPSAIIPEEFNYILNPLHPRKRRLYHNRDKRFYLRCKDKDDIGWASSPNKKPQHRC